MIKLDAGQGCPSCDGLSRRSFVQLGLAGLGSLGLPNLLRAQAARRERGMAPKDTRVILLWLEGGPSHMDLWDMKPDAPPEYRGYWRPISTNVPGIRITEMFPLQAKLADKFSMVRTLHHDDGDHIGSAHILLTGRPGPTIANLTPKSPSLGSIAARTAGSRRMGVPPYTVIPHARSGTLRYGYHGATYVGHGFDPFETGGDPSRKDFRVQNLVLPGELSVSRLDDRRHLRRSLDRFRRDADQSGALEAMDHFEEQAYQLVTSPAVTRAFDLASEDERVRDRYGRTTWGQSVLLARRMAEAGVTFTTVQLGGWDQHGDIKARMEDYLPRIDKAVSALFEDLSGRGLLEQVLVVVCGEMSRTPKMNEGFQGLPPGRDHWSSAISLVLGGGGVQGGRIVGKTDAHGETIVERPVTPEELHSTIYHVLGIDPNTTFVDPSGRPVPAVDRDEPIRELL
jgi:hypothetical protein